MAANIKKITEEEFSATIAKGIVLVDFYADWCGPCRMLAPVLEHVGKEVEGKAIIVKIDIDQASQVTDSYKVTSIPTLILFKEGKEVNRIVGLRDADYIADFIKAVY